MQYRSRTSSLWVEAASCAAATEALHEQRKPELPFHRARQKAAHAVLLPVGCLHHLFDAGPLRLAQQGEHALLLGDTLWCFSLRRCLGGGNRRFIGLGWPLR